METALLRGWGVSPSNIFQSFHSLALAHGCEMDAGVVNGRGCEYQRPKKFQESGLAEGGLAQI